MYELYMTELLVIIVWAAIEIIALCMFNCLIDLGLYFASISHVFFMIIQSRLRLKG